MFEPIIKTDISILPKNIETNLDDLKPFIDEKVKNAKSLVVNADNIEECEHAEADAALLTKLAKKVSEFRLTWTKQWQSPFEGVIAKCKDYEKQLKEAGEDLRQKAKAGRDKVRAEKRVELENIWRQELSDIFGEEAKKFPHFDNFFKMMTDEATTGCWTNRGKKVEKCVDEMRVEINRCSEALNSLRTMFADHGADIQQVAEDALGKHFDMNEAIESVNSYKNQQERIEAARIAAQERSAAQAAQTAANPAPTAPAPAPAASDAPRTMTQDAPVSVKLESYRLKVTGTRGNLVAMRKWGEAHGITFENLDK